MAARPIEIPYDRIREFRIARIETFDKTQQSYSGTLAPMDEANLLSGGTGIDFVHQIGSRLASGSGLHEVLQSVVQVVSAVVRCDSCFVYVREGDELVLRASRNPHPEVLDRLMLRLGEGITGWVAEHRQPVSIAGNASRDQRFRAFSELPEDTYEAFLSVPILCRERVVGVINVQHRLPHEYSEDEVRLVSTLGFLVGAEVERARLEGEVTELTERLEARKLIERAKGIVQRHLGITESEAYRVLQRQSRQRRKPMKEIAEAVLMAEELRGEWETAPGTEGGTA